MYDSKVRKIKKLVLNFSVALAPRAHEMLLLPYMGLGNSLDSLSLSCQL